MAGFGIAVVLSFVVAQMVSQEEMTRLGYDPAVEQATWRGERVLLPQLLSLGWYAGFGGDAALTPQQRELRAGQRWRFTVRLRQPHGNQNPHGFDYELYLNTPQLLACQKPFAELCNADELQFQRPIRPDVHRKNVAHLCVQHVLQRRGVGEGQRMRRVDHPESGPMRQPGTTGLTPGMRVRITGAVSAAGIIARDIVIQ